MTGNKQRKLAGEPTNHHYVSQGYQRNFATNDRRITVFDARTGDVIQKRRAVKHNFALDDFNTFYPEDGQPDRRLESAFARVEAGALHTARHLAIGDQGTDRRRAIAEMFAIHLIRNPAHRRFQDRCHDKNRADLVAAVVADALQNRPFHHDDNPNPTETDLERIANERYEVLRTSRRMYVDAMIRQYNLAAQLLETLHLQIVETPTSSPGFVLGDVPIVHYHPETGRFGFDDDLALKDAGCIIGPIDRHKAVLITSRPEASVLGVNNSAVHRINALLIRGASDEIACHPDDYPHARTVVDNLTTLLQLNPSPSSYLEVDPTTLCLRSPR